MKLMLLALVALLACALAAPVGAQPGAMGGEKGPGPGMGPGGGPGRGMGMGMGMKYNPQTLITVKGTVEKLEDFPSPGPGGQSGGKYRIIILKTDAGQTHHIHLGPTWYFDQKKFSLKTGDEVEVTGSKVTMGQQEIILAGTVKCGGKTLHLRDDQGVPAWRPWQAKRD